MKTVPPTVKILTSIGGSGVSSSVNSCGDPSGGRHGYHFGHFGVNHGRGIGCGRSSPKVDGSAANSVSSPSPDASPVKLKPPTPLPLLSVTIAVIVALVKLKTRIGFALSLTAAGGPALIEIRTEPDSFAGVAIAVISTYPAVLPEA